MARRHGLDAMVAADPLSVVLLVGLQEVMVGIVVREEVTVEVIVVVLIPGGCFDSWTPTEIK